MLSWKDPALYSAIGALGAFDTWHLHFMISGGSVSTDLEVMEATNNARVIQAK